VETADGPLFAKRLADPPPGMFEVEAAGLRWLAEPGVIPVPAVRHVDARLLVLAWIEPGRATAASQQEFGRALARLHDTGAPSFGRVFDVPGIGLDVPDRIGAVAGGPAPVRHLGRAVRRAPAAPVGAGCGGPRPTRSGSHRAGGAGHRPAR